MNANIFGALKNSHEIFVAVKIYLGDESLNHTDPVTARRRSENDPKTPRLRGRKLDVGAFGLQNVRKLPPLCPSFFLRIVPVPLSAGGAR